MQIVLTGGGTAGHVVPNLAIADAIAKQNPKAKLYYVGSIKGMERAMVEDHGLPFYGIQSGKLRRYFSVENFLDLFRIPVGVLQAWRILGRLKPSCVFSKGGFVAFPVVLAARLRGIPVLIHESDAVAGLTTRLCARWAQKILLAYPSAEAGLSRYKDKIEVCGNPIRPEITEGDAELAKRITGFSGERPVLLVMGGSSGSSQLNGLIDREKEVLTKDFDLIHLTGGRHLERVSEPHYWAAGFVGIEMKDLYALSTHAVSRAGANSLAELEALGLPTLLYPLGRDASRGDQIVNAQHMAEKHEFMVVADEMAPLHAQLLRLPSRKKGVKTSPVAEQIARMLLGARA